MPTRHGIFVHTLNQVADAALLFIMGACLLMLSVICLFLSIAGWRNRLYRTMIAYGDFETLLHLQMRKKIVVLGNSRVMRSTNTVRRDSTQRPEGVIYADPPEK